MFASNPDGAPASSQGIAAKASAYQSAASQQALDQEIAPETQTVISDLNSGNYSGAWSSALSTSPLFNTNYNSATTDPLLQAMESGSGLEQLDPSKTWNSQSINQFYSALGSNPVYNGQTVDGVNGKAESLGQNPYGLWGSGSAVTGGSDASANASTAGDNSAPDVERFAGAKPTTSFLSKYGADIAALVATVATAGAGAPALGAALAGSAAADIVNAAQGKLSVTGALEGAGLSVLGAAVPGLGNALGSATGIGTTAGTALAGAGIGALGSAVTGGNPLVGALSGGVSGAVQGSGVVKAVGGDIGNALGGGTLANAAGSAIAGGGLGAATGAGLSALTGGNVANAAITGGVGGALRGAVGSATGSSTLGSIAGGLGTMAISPLLSNGSVAPVNTAINPVQTAVNPGSTVIPNNGSMMTANSTGSNGYDFSSLGSTIGSLLGPSLQSASGVYGAQNAAEDEEQGTSNAITQQQQTLAQIQGNNASTLSGIQANNANTLSSIQGTDASTLSGIKSNNAGTLSNLSNIFGAQIGAGNNADAQIQALEGSGTTPANYSNFINSPGYQFAVSQGTQAIQRQAAATGQGYTPNTLDAVGQYVTGTASQNYNNYMSQLQATAGLGAQGNAALAGDTTNISNNTSQATQALGLNTANAAQTLGLNTSGAQQTLGLNTSGAIQGAGNNISTLMQNLGQEGASGVLGASGAVGSSIGQIGNGISSLLGLGGNNNLGGLANSSGNLLSTLTNPNTNTAATSAALPSDMTGTDANNPVTSSSYYQQMQGLDSSALDSQMAQQGQQLADQNLGSNLSDLDNDFSWLDFGS